MPSLPLLRSFLIQLLALLKGLSHKMIGAKARMRRYRVSYLLGKDSEIADADFASLLAGVEATPAEVAVGTACYEALTALKDDALPPAYRGEIEVEILEMSRICRETFTHAALLSLQISPGDGYPRPGDVEAARHQARQRLGVLRNATPVQRSALVKVSSALQTWACAEEAAEESVQAASRDLEEAMAWARFGAEIAELVPGPERLQAKERMAVLRTLDEPTRLLLVQIDEDYQTWALCAEAAETARRSQDRREARAWAGLSVEIAKRVRGTEAWRNRIQGLALAHEGHFLGNVGTLAEARRLWKAGADPDGLLSAGGLLP